jgi:hypothetical protein
MAKDWLPEKFETEMGLMKLLMKNMPILGGNNHVHQQ